MIPSRYYCIVAGVAITVNLNTLNGDFVYDDSQAIIANGDVSGRSSLWRIFSDDFWGTPLSHPGSHRSYRPLTVLTFRLNYMLSGLYPFSYHLVNVICHAITSALFIALTDRLIEISQILKLFCGLLFAVHAVHAEAVASIVGRADVLSTMCVLGAFYVHLRNEAIFMPILISAVGLLCKETAIVSLPILALYCFIKGYRERRTHIFAFLSSTILLCVLRLWIIGFSAPEFSPADNPIAHHPSALSRLLTFLYLPIFHLFLLIFPYNLCFDWSMNAIKPIESPLEWRFLGTWLCYMILIFSTLRLFLSLPSCSKSTISEVERRCESRSPSPKFDINANIIKRRKRGHFHDDRAQSSRRSTPTCSVTSDSTEKIDQNMQWLLSIALLVLPHVPASNLLVYVGFVVAERILYLPSTGFCILITLIIDRLYRSLSRTQRIMRKLVEVFCICLLLAHTIRLTKRNVEWGDEEALYRSALLINPAKAYANLGNVLARRGQKEEAQRAYRLALEHRPNMADTHYNLGVLYQEIGDYARAVSSYHTAIIYRPTLASAHLNLGLCLWHQGKHDIAEQVFRHCLLLDSAGLKIPRGHRTAQAACAYNLGVMLAKLYRHSDAIVAYTKAFEFMDGDYEGLASTLNMMGESLSQIGQLKEAEDYFRRALTVAPSHIPAYLTFSQLRFRLTFV
uniref:dolichyl-phosphate-mannose--protein mannosyltransferase n=1 Tax=Ascaris suum TaxID=6253 RepID=F1KV56_ASCSU